MLWFRADSANIFTMSFYRQLWIDNTWEVKVRARDKQYSFCFLIPEIKDTKILKRLIWMYFVLHNMCMKHLEEETSRRGILSRYWSLRFGKDWHSDILSDSIECNHPSRNTSSLFVFRKLLEWKLEKSFSKKFSCQINLRQRSHWKHEWKTELGSDHAQRAEVGQLSTSFQSNQPTLNRIRERLGRPDIAHDVIGVQDERKTSRSEEIVNSFNEEPSSSDRTGRPGETEEIQTFSSEDSKSLNVEQTHDRTERPVAALHTAAVQYDSQVYHEANTLNVDDEVFRKTMEKSIVVHEKAYMSPRLPPKISLRHDWTKELGSKDRQPQEEVARQPQEEVVRQGKFFHSTQPIPKPICDRSRQLDNTQHVFVVEGDRC